MPFPDNGNIEQFLSEMGKVPLLTAAEEIMLGSAVQRGKAEDATPGQKRAGMKAKNRMIQANLRLVVTVSRKYLHRQKGSLEWGDLIQEGCLGLNRACEKFDPELGYKFSTYAYWWIRQGISRAIDQTSSTIRIPTSMNQTVTKLNQLPPGLTSKEICEELEISEEQLKNVRLAQVAKDPKSIDMHLGNDSNKSVLGDVLPDERSTLNIDKFKWEAVRDSLEVQAEFAQNNEIELLRRNVVDGESLQVMAKEIGISRERLRQLLNRTKRHLALRMIEHRELVA